MQVLGAARGLGSDLVPHGFCQDLLAKASQQVSLDLRARGGSLGENSSWGNGKAMLQRKWKQ